MTKPLPDPLNSDDEDAAKVAAALADAAHAGGLPEGYYREAEAALRRLSSRTIKGTKTTVGYLDPANWSWCEELESWRGPGDHSVEIDPDVSTVIIEDWCDVAQAPIEIVVAMSERDLWRTRGVGRKSIATLKARLASAGLALRQDGT